MDRREPPESLPSSPAPAGRASSRGGKATYREMSPAPELLPYVAAYWTFASSESRRFVHHVPLTGGAIVALPQPGLALLSGPRAEPLEVEIEPGARIHGIHFWPGAAAAFLGLENTSLRDRDVALAELIDETSANRLAEVAHRSIAQPAIARPAIPRPDIARPALEQRVADEQHEEHEAAEEEERCRLLDRALLPLLAHALPLDPVVMPAVFRLLARPRRDTVGRVARDSGLSPRHFRRRFLQITGLTASELVRIQRLRESARAFVTAGPSAWIDLAADHGYADQGHLIREYQKLLGLSPTAFESTLGRIRHGDIVR